MRKLRRAFCRVGCHGVIRDTFATAPLRTLRPSFPETRLSSKLEVWNSLTSLPPAPCPLQLPAFRLRQDFQATCLPVLLRPAIGVTVSLVGRDSRDYHQDSVTLWVAPRRPSRLPYAVNVIGCLRCVTHHLASTPCARFSAAIFQTNTTTYGLTFFRLTDPNSTVHTETWVSGFTGYHPGYFGFPMRVVSPNGD
jgi:hypothetical protein